MKLHILSDLHAEHQTPDFGNVEADVLVLAGDIGVGLKGLDLVAMVRERYDHVVYVPGNHEYYGHSLPRLDAKMKARADAHGIELLQCRSVQLAGIRFLGCTLWTDFDVGAPAIPRATAVASAEASMMDFSSIRVDPSYRRLNSADVMRLNRSHLAWLERELRTDQDQTCVVVTHHAPHPTSIAPKHQGSPLNGAFASDLSSLIESGGPSVWIHGHTHHCVDYEVSRTRIVSNQLGYPGECTSGYDAGCCVEL